MINSITITNSSGNSLQLVLKQPELSGFKVMGIIGLGPVNASLNFTNYGSGDGSMFNTARVDTRNIVLTLAFMAQPDIETIRQLSYKYFPLKGRVKIDVVSDNRILTTYGYVEKNEPNIFSSAESTQVSIICENPYFTGQTNQITNPIPLNLCPNPTVAIDTTGWSFEFGPGGTTVDSRVTSGGYSGPTFYRGTETVRANNLGECLWAPLTKALPNTTYTLSVWIRMSIANVVYGYVRNYNNGSDVAGNTTGPYVTVPANTWTRVVVTATTAATTNGMRLSVSLGGTGTAIMPVGATWDADAAQYELGTVATDFDIWSGEDSSISRNIYSFDSITSEALLWHPIPGAGGAATTAAVSTGGVANSSFIRMQWTSGASSGDGIYADQVPCTPGATYTLSVWIRPSWSTIVQTTIAFYKGGVNFSTNAVSPNVVLAANVWTLVSMTFTVPAQATGLNVGWFIVGAHTSSAVTPIIDTDQLLCEKGTVVGPYFTGLKLKVMYSGEVETGAIFKIHSIGSVTSILVQKLETGQAFLIDTGHFDIILGGTTTYYIVYNDDNITITTITGSKSAVLTRTIQYNILNALAPGSQWLTLTPGINTFQVTCFTGVENLRMSVESPIIYMGV